jgi:hypothetical protein
MVFHEKNLKFLSRFRTWSVKVGKCEALEYV